MSTISSEALHAQFVEFGIDRAVKNILKKESKTIDILAFSIGGTIAWKANINGLKVRNLYAISSTRLRKEESKPSSNIVLHFGNHDQFKPDKTWFTKLDIEANLIKNEGHEFYKNSKFAKIISSQIIENLPKSKNS